MQNVSHSVIARWFFVVLATLILYLYWQIISPYIIVLVTAGIAAVIVSPLEARLRKRIKHPRVSAVIMIVLMLVAIVGPALILGAIVGQQINDIINQTIANPAWRESFDFQDLA